MHIIQDRSIIYSAVNDHGKNGKKMDKILNLKLGSHYRRWMFQNFSDCLIYSRVPVFSLNVVVVVEIQIHNSKCNTYPHCQVFRRRL